jgi:hypothetical protein
MTQERRWAKTGRGMAGLPVSSWRATLITAVVIVALFAVVIGVASTYGPLRHTSFPGHPYPPAGYVQNPFSSNPDDLLSAADVARVRTDLLADGDSELRAFALGDKSVLSQADVGNRLTRLEQILDENDANGIVQREQDNRGSIVVGRLPDPRDPSITWCVQETGTSTLTDISKSGGQQLRVQRYRFEGRFWLSKVGDHYLIADADVTNQSLTSG